MSDIVQLRQVSKSYQASPQSPVQEVLRGVDLSIAPGESLSITGPSGCGKSTLLHIIGTLDRPESGTVTLFGEDAGTLDEAGLSRLRATRTLIRPMRTWVTLFRGIRCNHRLSIWSLSRPSPRQPLQPLIPHLSPLFR